MTTERSNTAAMGPHARGGVFLSIALTLLLPTLCGCASGPELFLDRPAGTLQVFDAQTSKPIPCAILRIVAADPTHPLRFRDILRAPETSILTLSANQAGLITLPTGIIDPNGRITAQVLAPGYLAHQLDLQPLADTTPGSQGHLHVSLRPIGPAPAAADAPTSQP